MARYTRARTRRRSSYSSSARRYRGGYSRPRRRTYTRRRAIRSPAAQTVRVVIQQGPSMPSVQGGAISLTGLRKARF